MFIQTESTPNPATLKFLPGRVVLGDNTRHFLSVAEAANAPLALALFAVDGVDSVFLGRDFISVTKNDAMDWQGLRPQILGTIMDHLGRDLPILSDAADSAGDHASTRDAEEIFAAEDANIVSQIKELLETRVRPAVAQDGGDIIFRGFQDGVVSLRLQGACAGCPSSTATLKMGIENMLRHYVPEVTMVQAV
ncbi:MAG: NifU family protein [Alphaproteobacteria bacterium]|nr:NifU family protein [Alphaproteobacteria bacterium]